VPFVAIDDADVTGQVSTLVSYPVSDQALLGVKGVA
jgi:hypothetical protein